MSRIQTVEEHFRELGAVDTKRHVPGLAQTEHREVRYAEDRGEEPFELLFRKLVRHISPPLMKDGGSVIDGCVLTLPTGRRFQAISYRGDIEGWRQQVSQGAKTFGLSLAQLVDDVLVLDDGAFHQLADCTVEFY